MARYSHATFNEYLTETIHSGHHPALKVNQLTIRKKHTIKNYTYRRKQNY